MANFDFSAEQKRVFSIVTDLVNGDYAHEEGVTKTSLENHLRECINKDIFGGLNFRQAVRRNKHTVYEVMEQITDIVVGENVLKSAFVDQFVEVKNRALNDRTDWVTEGDSLLTVASFAGNHWDTNREALDGGAEYTLDKEWVYIHVYDEFERFLLGIASLERLTDVIYKSFNKYIKERTYVMFQSVMDVVPAEFTANGNSEEAVGNLCDLVQAAGGYSNLTIAGTNGALRKLAGVIPNNYFAESQREAKAKTGNIGDWEGKRLMVIPQVIKEGTFELALDNDTLFIMGGDVKPIKVEFIGDTRTQNVTDHRVNNDMTYDLQVQTLFGCGFELPQAFGCFKFA